MRTGAVFGACDPFSSLEWIVDLISGKLGKSAQDQRPETREGDSTPPLPEDVLLNVPTLSLTEAFFYAWWGLYLCKYCEYQTHRKTGEIVGDWYTYCEKCYTIACRKIPVTPLSGGYFCPDCSKHRRHKRHATFSRWPQYTERGHPDSFSDDMSRARRKILESGRLAHYQSAGRPLGVLAVPAFDHITGEPIGPIITQQDVDKMMEKGQTVEEFMNALPDPRVSECSLLEETIKSVQKAGVYC
jgi:hypothetical protein